MQETLALRPEGRSLPLVVLYRGRMPCVQRVLVPRLVDRSSRLVAPYPGVRLPCMERTLVTRGSPTRSQMTV